MSAVRACANSRAPRAWNTGGRSWAAATPCSSTGRDAATATITRPGSSGATSASWSVYAQPPSPRRGSSLPDDCLFCQLYREVEHVNSTDGFVAIRDINPKADTHLLVIPERHVETFRDVGEFPPEEARRMLVFIAETARGVGLDDYKGVVNVGRGAGQAIFDLDWDILGGRIRGLA